MKRHAFEAGMLLNANTKRCSSQEYKVEPTKAHVLCEAPSSIGLYSSDGHERKERRDGAEYIPWQPKVHCHVEGRQSVRALVDIDAEASRSRSWRANKCGSETPSDSTVRKSLFAEDIEFTSLFLLSLAGNESPCTEDVESYSARAEGTGIL